jgi:DNA replication protein DnaC
MFFHVVNTRYEKGHPTLVTTNRGLPAWGQIFGDAVVAAAILDRLMHKAIVFNIRGPSWRLRGHNGLDPDGTLHVTDPRGRKHTTRPPPRHTAAA